MESSLYGVIAKSISSCELCSGACNKKLPTGAGEVLYVIPYDSEDEEILKKRGVVIREVACENGVDFVCNVYVRTLFSLFKLISTTPDYASHLLGRKVEEFETFILYGKKFVAATNQCDIRVSQELGK